MNRGIYVHVPYCTQKCPYCDFYSVIYDESSASEYTDAVICVIESYKNRGVCADTLYFGGGTPNLIGSERIGAVLKAIKENFILPCDAEITLEANPETFRKQNIAAFKEAGINRLSMGLQSAVDSELCSLGRRHTNDDVAFCVREANKAGIQNVSLDLMLGIEGQSKASLLKSIEFCADLGVSHLSAYMLKIEPNTPYYKNRSLLNLPDDDKAAELYLFAVDELKKRGFEQYEISNFAKDGFLSRHNMKYWTLGEYWGFGPSAHSLVGKKRFSYIRDTSRYISAMKCRDEVIEKIETINTSERCGEYLMLGLRTTDGIVPETVEKKYLTHFDEIEKVLLKYHKTGHAEFDGTKWWLTPEGFLISNMIIGDVLDALEISEHLVRPLKG